MGFNFEIEHLYCTGQGQRLRIQHPSKIVSRSTRTHRFSDTPNKWTCMELEEDKRMFGEVIFFLKYANLPILPVVDLGGGASGARAPPWSGPRRNCAVMCFPINSVCTPPWPRLWIRHWITTFIYPRFGTSIGVITQRHTNSQWSPKDWPCWSQLFRGPQS